MRNGNKVKKMSAFFLSILIFSGCCIIDDNNAIQNHETYEMNSESSEQYFDSSSKEKVAQKMYVEFCQYYNNMEEDDFITYIDPKERADYNLSHNKTAYNRIMAADRATALLGVYKDFISDEQLTFVSSKKDEINDGFFADSRVLFGYTASGLHFVALYRGITNNSMLYEGTCNKIRRLNDESTFFDDILYGDMGYWACDLFIEDLSQIRQSVDSVDVEFYEWRSNDENVQREIISDFSEEDRQFFEKYNRKISNPYGMLKVNEWSLFFTSRHFNRVRIIVDGEELWLTDVIP